MRIKGANGGRSAAGVEGRMCTGGEGGNWPTGRNRGTGEKKGRS